MRGKEGEREREMMEDRGERRWAEQNKTRGWGKKKSSSTLFHRIVSCIAKGTELIIPVALEDSDGS